MDTRVLIGLRVKDASSGVRGRIISTETDETDKPFHFDVLLNEVFPMTCDFPDAFTTMKSLISEDAVLDEAIINWENRYRCTICGNHSGSLNPIEGGRVCQNCMPQVPVCRFCFRRVSPTPSYSIVDAGTTIPVCSSCRPQHVISCNICGRELLAGRNRTGLSKIPDWEYMCDHCAKLGCVECFVCGEKIRKVDVIKKQNRLYCSDCFHIKSDVCVDCGDDLSIIYKQSNVPGLCGKCVGKREYREYVIEKVENMYSLLEMQFSEFKFSSLVTLMSRLHPKYPEFIKMNTGLKREPPIDALAIEMIGEYDLLILPYDENGSVKKIFDGRCTASYFKGTGKSRWLELIRKRPSEPIEMIDGQVLHLWRNPYEFRAETIFDRLYGNEYHGDELYFQGNNYGDTSPFMIVGYISEK